MKHTYFRNYIVDLDGVFKDSREEHAKILKAMKDAEAKAEKARSDRSLSQERKQIAELELREAKQVFRKSMEELSKNTDAKIKAIRADLEADSAEYLSIDTSKVDAVTLNLINSGIMNANDYRKLANDNWNNPTILRLIASKGKDAKDMDLRVLCERANRFCNPTARMQVFDGAVDLIRRTLPTDGSDGNRMAQLWTDEGGFDSYESTMSQYDQFTDSFQGV